MKSRVKGKMRCIKYLMFLFNFLFWLSGVALIILGALGELLYGDIKDNTQAGFTSATAILMAVGSVITVFSFAGCYGAWRENYYTLKVFSYMLVVLLIVELALGFWVYFAHFDVGGFLLKFLKDILSSYEEDKDIQELIDKVQKKYQCCGMNSYKDWFKSEWNVKRQNESVDRWQNNVPRSCCLVNTTYLLSCGDDLDTDSKPAERFVHTEGCVRMKKYFSRNVSVIISVGTVMLSVQVMAILFVCCLRRAIKHSYFFEYGDRVQLVL